MIAEIDPSITPQPCAAALVDRICLRLGLVLLRADRDNLISKIALLPGSWRGLEGGALARSVDNIELADPMLGALVWDRVMILVLTAAVMSVPDPTKRGPRSTAVKNVFALACRTILLLRGEKNEA